MIDTLRSFTRKSGIIRIVIGAVVMIACLIITKFAIFDLILGPVEIDMTQDPAQYEGRWATIQVQNLLTDYVEHRTTTEYESGRTTTSTDGNSYIAFYADDNYETMTSTWYYFSFYLPQRDQEEAYAMIDDTWAYWEDYSGTVEAPEPMEITGTWEKLEGDLLDYYIETLEYDLGIVEDGDDIFVGYTLNTDSVGGVKLSTFVILTIVAFVALVYIIVQIVKVCSNGCAKTIARYVQENPGISMSQVETDFASAHQIGKQKVWIGRNWTVYITGMKVHIFANKDAVWAYYYRRTGRGSVSEMRVYMIGKKIHHIPLTEAQTQEAMGYYGAEQPHMVLGYSAELLNMFNKNFQDFLNLKYNPVRQQQAQDPFNSVYNS